MSNEGKPGLRHELSAAQMAMVGVGGSIGTGLFLSSGRAIQIAGPAVIISFILGAIITYFVAMAFGELASTHPDAGSFGLYAELYVNDWAGFLARYGYWFSVVTAMGGELVASATYMGFWFPQVKAIVWVLFFAAALLGANLLTVGHYGWFEYWFAMIKVATITAFIAIGAGLLFTGRFAPQFLVGDGTPQQNFFPHGMTGPLLAVSLALFSFLGVEMVAIASGESRTAQEVARAARITFIVLTIAYVGASAVLVGVMPWNRAGLTQSPFVTVFEFIHIPAASAVMNFVVLTAALSGANATLYIASRMMFSMAQIGYAPRKLTHLGSDGVPRLALLASSFGILVAIVMIKAIPENAFIYIIGASLFGGMLAWWATLAAHINFRRRITPQQLAALNIRSPFGATGSVVAFVAIVAAIGGTWWTMRVTIYSGIVLTAVLSTIYFLLKMSRGKAKITS